MNVVWILLRKQVSVSIEEIRALSAHTLFQIVVLLQCAERVPRTIAKSVAALGPLPAASVEIATSTHMSPNIAPGSSAETRPVRASVHSLHQFAARAITHRWSQGFCLLLRQWCWAWPWWVCWVHRRRTVRGLQRRVSSHIRWQREVWSLLWMLGGAETCAAREAMRRAAPGRRPCRAARAGGSGSGGALTMPAHRTRARRCITIGSESWWGWETCCSVSREHDWIQINANKIHDQCSSTTTYVNDKSTLYEYLYRICH